MVRISKEKQHPSRVDTRNERVPFLTALQQLKKAALPYLPSDIPGPSALPAAGRGIRWYIPSGIQQEWYSPTREHKGHLDAQREARRGLSPTASAGIRGQTGHAFSGRMFILERGARRARIANRLALGKRRRSGGVISRFEAVLARARPAWVPHVRWKRVRCKRLDLGGDIGALQAEARLHVQIAS